MHFLELSCCRQLINQSQKITINNTSLFLQQRSTHEKSAFQRFGHFSILRLRRQRHRPLTFRAFLASRQWSVIQVLSARNSAYMRQ